MQGAVFLLHGSQRMFCLGMSGNCLATMAAYFSLVTTHTFSAGTNWPKRSTVNCNSVLPVPSTSINCFGFSAVLMGQKRLPTPPAMMTR